MKRYLFIALFVVLLMLSGCLNNEAVTIYQNYDFNSQVKLCNYKNIEIERSYVEIEDEDLLAIIYLDFSSNNYFLEVEKDCVDLDDFVLMSINDGHEDDYEYFFYEVGSGEFGDYFDEVLLEKSSYQTYSVSIDDNEVIVSLKGIYEVPDATDEKTVIEFYGMDSMTDVEKYLRARASDEIVYNYMWDYILENSEVLSYPEEKEISVNESINNIVNTASESGITVEEYLDSMGITIEDIEQSVETYYYEQIIGEAILLQEGIIVDDELIAESEKELKKQNNLSDEDLELYYTQEEIHSYAVTAAVRDVLISYVIIK